MNRISIIKPILSELLTRKPILRIPEPELIMENEEQVIAFDQAGQSQGPIDPVYLFSAIQITRTIQGSKNVLDLGCGSAQLLSRMAQANPTSQFTGVDLSDKMLTFSKALLNEKKITNVNLIKSDMTRLDGFVDHSFDAVYSSLALHHLPDEKSLESFFIQLVRVLKPGGKFVLFDYSLLKSKSSLEYLLLRGGLHHSKVYIDDTFNSMQAAFPTKLYQELAKKYFSTPMEFHSAFLFPFMFVLSSKKAELTESQLLYFKSIYSHFNHDLKNNYKDIVMLFCLSGLKTPKLK